ncbi:amidohydrolase family protein [Glycomyces niveus]|jgi:aminocarboxymuconate-semialdehyde decarboxylase|uniref:Amidohydrolase n=1 Tax=Glycomyces niveus TaxID=2820287 RepID=A0ABS3U6M1_9ACTN|nr:amidohydrolase family protein [Glycomyces sp. NEAU-S30]MBO3734424.1 amidohydrolase [Glycomyces sp. NEAU-S30]
MKIDAYSHILPPRYFEAMREHAPDLKALKRWLTIPALHDVDARLRMMDEFGPDYQQILTLSSPPVETIAGPEESWRLARLANEEMRSLVDEHPSRFPAFVAALPLNDIEASLAEMRYAIDELGAVGVQVFTNVNGVPLDDPRFAPVFAEAAGRGLPVWMHPARSAAASDYRTEDQSKFEVWWALGWPYETSVAMSRMVFSGLLERHPDLAVVTHHLGAMIPYFEGRIRLGWADQFGSRTHGSEAAAVLDGLSKPPIEYFRSFYADTALSGSAIGTRCGLEFFGAEHVLFASDCPFDPEGGPMYIREMIRIIDGLDITEEDRELIYAGNLHRITGHRLK